MNKIISDRISNYRVKYPSNMISQQVQHLASKITEYINAQERIVIAPVMKGAMFFCADLYGRLPFCCEMSYCHYFSYINNQKNCINAKVYFPEAEHHFKGASVIIVDDICDSGDTLDSIYQSRWIQAAKEVKSVVLVDRVVETKVVQPDWAAFVLDSQDWLVGYGMDDNGQFRNLRTIYTI